MTMSHRSTSQRRLPTPFRDDKRLRNRRAKRVEPDTGLEMEAHAGLKDRPVARAQAHGSFAPVRRETKTDGEADTTFPFQAVAVENPLSGSLDLLAGCTGTR